MSLVVVLICVQKWNGKYFEKTTLQDLGAVLQLGHPPGERCAAPAIGPRACMVIHTNGFHPVTVLFCGCTKLSRAGDRVEQLLRAELYPASLTDPTTFCTVRVLEYFHLQTLQSKITAYDFYMTLQRLTDVTGLEKQYVSISCFSRSASSTNFASQDRLKPFLRMVREWRYLKLLKRAGRGHISGGTKNIQPGELCLRCPACPRPGFNLPTNWTTASDELKYVHRVSLLSVR